MVYEIFLPTEKIIIFDQEAPEVWRMLQWWHLTSWCVFGTGRENLLSWKSKKYPDFGKLYFSYYSIEVYLGYFVCSNELSNLSSEVKSCLLEEL